MSSVRLNCEGRCGCPLVEVQRQVRVWHPVRIVIEVSRCSCARRVEVTRWLCLLRGRVCCADRQRRVCVAEGAAGPRVG